VKRLRAAACGDDFVAVIGAGWFGYDVADFLINDHGHHAGTGPGAR
jgi:hypothetical protein